MRHPLGLVNKIENKKKSKIYIQVDSWLNLKLQNEGRHLFSYTKFEVLNS